MDCGVQMRGRLLAGQRRIGGGLDAGDERGDELLLELRAGRVARGA